MLYQEKNAEVTPFGQDTELYGQVWAGPRVLQLGVHHTLTRGYSTPQSDIHPVFLNQVV